MDLQLTFQIEELRNRNTFKPLVATSFLALANFNPREL